MPEQDAAGVLYHVVVDEFLSNTVIQKNDSG
jgi:hypothetical protein